MSTAQHRRPLMSLTMTSAEPGQVLMEGLAVLIIIVYYVTVYDPSVEPFDITREGTLSNRPNPLGALLLRWIRFGPAYLSKRWLGSRQPLSPYARSQLKRVLIKCLLLMSDLQIVTGFAILLSGYAQWECGLAALKWRTILNLARFSCLTHLSCLTLLRQYLHTRTVERLWRLFAMGALAVLLATGLLLTTNPKWLLLSKEMKAIPTICIVGCYLKPRSHKEWRESMGAVACIRNKLWLLS